VSEKKKRMLQRGAAIAALFFHVRILGWARGVFRFRTAAADGFRMRIARRLSENRLIYLAWDPMK
jgi:hypothetical protein